MGEFSCYTIPGDNLMFAILEDAGENENVYLMFRKRNGALIKDTNDAVLKIAQDNATERVGLGSAGVFRSGMPNGWSNTYAMDLGF